MMDNLEDYLALQARAAGRQRRKPGERAGERRRRDAVAAQADAGETPTLRASAAPAASSDDAAVNPDTNSPANPAGGAP